MFLLDLLYIERYWVQWTFHKVGPTRDGGIRIAQITDLHLRELSRVHRGIASRLSEEKIDLIVITGDAVEDPAGIPLLDDFLGQMDASISKVAILGNWEYWGNVDLTALRYCYDKHNVTLLVNEQKVFTFNNRTIAVSGMDDLVGGIPDYAKTVAGMPKADFHLLLTHCPQHRDEMAKLPTDEQPDLVLSGHTHGGQIALLGWAPVTPQGSGQYLAGWYDDQLPPLYVCKGVGTSILPIRFGARAEVAVFEV